MSKPITIEDIESEDHKSIYLFDMIDEFIRYPNVTFEEQQRALAVVDKVIGEEPSEITQIDIDKYIEATE